MADDAKLTVELKGEGNLKDELKKTKEAAKKLKDEAKELAKQEKEAQRATKEAARARKQAAQAAAKRVKEQEQALKKLTVRILAVGAAFIGVKKAIDGITELGKEGAVDEMLGRTAARNFGNTAKALEGFRAAVNGTVSDTGLLKLANQMKVGSLTTEEITTVMMAAKRASADLGEEFGSLARQVAANIASGEFEGLKRVFGDIVITALQQIEVEQKMGAAMGETTKKLRLRAIVLEEMKKKNDEANESLEDSRDIYLQLTTATDNARSAIAKELNQEPAHIQALKNRASVLNFILKLMKDMPKRDILGRLIPERLPGLPKPAAVEFEMPELKKKDISAGAVGPVGVDKTAADRAMIEQGLGNLPGAFGTGEDPLREAELQKEIEWNLKIVELNNERIDAIVQAKKDGIAREEALQRSADAKRQSMAASLNAALQAGYVQLTEMFGFALGQMLTGQEINGSDMLASVMDLLGQFAIKVGLIMLPLSTALAAIQSLNPVAALIGGLALIAAGGALKAAASSLRSEGQANASGAGLPGGGIPLGSGQSATGAPSLTPREDRDDEGTQTIVFNITGVVGGQDTARAINGLINQHSGRGAPKIRQRALAGT